MALPKPVSSLNTCVLATDYSFEPEPTQPAYQCRDQFKNEPLQSLDFASTYFRQTPAIAFNQTPAFLGSGGDVADVKRPTYLRQWIVRPDYDKAIRDTALVDHVEMKTRGKEYENLVADFALVLYHKNPNIRPQVAERKINEFRNEAKTRWENATRPGSHPSLEDFNHMVDIGTKLGGGLPMAGKYVEAFGSGVKLGAKKTDDWLLKPARQKDGQRFVFEYWNRFAGNNRERTQALIDLAEKSPSAKHVLDKTFFSHNGAPYQATVDERRRLDSDFDHHSRVRQIENDVTSISETQVQIQTTQEAMNAKQSEMYTAIQDIQTTQHEAAQEQRKFFKEQVGLIQDHNQKLGVVHQSQISLQKGVDALLKAAENEEQRDAMMTALMEHGVLVGEETRDIAAANGVRLDRLLEIEETRLAYEEKAREQAIRQAEHQRTVNNARAGVQGVATVFNLLGKPETARQASVIGNAVIDIADMMTGDKIANMGAMAATGNFLAIGMSVASLFMDQGPSPEQMILEGIQTLQKQVDQMRKEMHARFDIIDEKLDRIYREMHEEFDKLIAIAQDDLRTSENVLAKLHELETDLARLSTQTNQRFLEGFARQYIENVTACTGPYGNTNPNQVDKCYFEFIKWATEHATNLTTSGNLGYKPFKDPTQKGYKPAPISDDEILDFLGNDQSFNPKYNYSDIGSRINFLANVAQARFGVKLYTQDRPLANPVVWASAADSFHDVLDRYRDYAQRPADRSGRLRGFRDVMASGDNVQQAIKNISDPAQGGGYDFFNKMMKAYYKDLVAFKAALHESAQAYLHSTHRDLVNSKARSTNFTTSTRAVLLLGDENQTGFDYRWYKKESKRNSVCGGSAHSLPLPEGVKNLIPKPYHLAHALGLGNIEFAWRFHGCTPVTAAGNGYHRFMVSGEIRLHAGGEYEFYRHEIYKNQYDGCACMTPHVGIAGRLDKVKNIMGGADGSNHDRLPGARKHESDKVVRARIRNTLLQNQKAYLKHYLAVIKGEINDGDGFSPQDAELRKAAKKLKASQVLLQSFVKLGLSKTLEADKELQALTFSRTGLADADSFGYAMLAAIEARQADPHYVGEPGYLMNINFNPADNLAELGDPRNRKDFMDKQAYALDQLFAKIFTNDFVPEGLGFIEERLGRLESLRNELYGTR